MKLRARQDGASAVLGPTGNPHVTSNMNGEMDVVTRPSQAGFSPLDLLYASLASCLALSARLAASNLGVLEKITQIAVHVGGEKATEGLARVARFDIQFGIQGDIDELTRLNIVRAAEDEICTISNTIRGNPEFSTSVSQ